MHSTTAQSRRDGTPGMVDKKVSSEGRKGIVRRTEGEEEVAWQ